MDSKLEIALLSLLEAVAQVGGKYRPPTLGELEEPPSSRPSAAAAAASAAAAPSDVSRRLDELQAQNALLQEQMLAQQHAMLQQQQALMELLAMGQPAPPTAKDEPTKLETEDLRSKLGVVR